MLYKKNTVNTSFSELYHANGATAGYDLFNRLSDFRRGVLSDTNADGVMDTVTTSSSTVNWTMDSQGNWTNRNGVTRTHNAENQITSGGMTYDANGNTTKDDRGYTLKYDAWNRLVEVKDTGGVVVQTFKYDGLNRRIDQHGQQFYYSKDWQILQDVRVDVKRQYVWSLAYVDAMVLRDREVDSNVNTGNLGIAGSGLDERMYVMQDGNWNVTGIVNAATGQVAERYVYDPYGSVTFLNASWGTLSASAYAWVFLHQGGRWDASSNTYHFRNRDYSPTLGRWMSEDPAGYVDGGSLYQYERSGPAEGHDPYGLWRIKRSSSSSYAKATSENGDTIAGLAQIIGLDASDWGKWLGLPDGPKPKSTTDPVKSCEDYEIPNTVIAYWGGEFGGFGKGYVAWDRDVATLKKRGFLVQEKSKLTAVAFEKVIASMSAGKQLQGLFFWGHGDSTEVLTDASKDGNATYFSKYANWHPNYKMGFGIMFCCDGGGAKNHFAGGALFWGINGTLVPTPTYPPSVESIVPPGSQGTNK